MLRIPPGRFRPLAWLALVFLALAALTRVALLAAVPDAAALPPGQVVRAFAVGLGYDVLAFVYFAWPLVVLLAVLPARWLERRRGRWPVEALCIAMAFGLMFLAVAEWVFWEEFQARFDFIAVDYLVYTTEVIGNIRESYPIGTILGALAAATAVLACSTRRLRRPTPVASGDPGRVAVPLAWLVATLVGTVAIDSHLKDSGANHYLDELAGNGIYQFFAAYRGSTIDYARYYRTMPRDAAFARVRGLVATPEAHFVAGAADPLERDIVHAGPERKLNVVLVSVESLSSSFVGPSTHQPSLTPNLDRLEADSLVFTRLYATGTRTVRGLEALALSVPPTPGESIVKREGNEGLYSLADVFNAKGYASSFLYGGYGAFDNMNHFFGSNGYRVYDRAAIPDASVHHANVWGVADEDLYTLALERFDAEHAAGRPFFAHLMTTSNHRPYTFPEGRVPYPQGKRDSAVAYTDWAIGDFVRRARTRPWFADTVFVFSADHCASSGGLAQLPVFRYHIPLWIYAPAHVAPARVDRMLAQIDIGPTVLGLLNMSYRSHFYGVDAFAAAPARELALIGNNQRLGLLHADRLTELAPRRQAETVSPLFDDDGPQPTRRLDEHDVLDAVAYYQTADYRFRHGLMRHAGPEVAATRTPAAARTVAMPAN
jgi:phosphoglycerol transferase MdoB-like AlkP superfamily enzyme